MQNLKILKFILLVLILISCSKEKDKKLLISEKELDLQMIQAYKEGLKELEGGDAIYAAKKFTEAELLFPQSEWAPRSALMAAYSYFSQAYYDDSIYELDRFLNKYKNHERTDYAYYLLGLSYYEKIVDEKRDLQSLNESKKYFEILIKEYPNNNFALDAENKLDLINEILASKEMYIAKYYIKRQKWIPAINRLKTVVENFDNTIYVEEALHRLVEVHYKLGLEAEAQKYASYLGYNYQSSKWYKQSYKVFNKNYKPRELKKAKNKKSILSRFKSLIK